MTTTKPLYVCGFLFDEATENIVLLKRNKPPSQAGLYNGLGGKVEPNERPIDTMQREFKEESGVYIENWIEFACLEQAEGISYFFYAKSDILLDVYSAEEQEVRAFKINDALNHLPLMPNLKWLILMCLDENVCYVTIQSK